MSHSSDKINYEVKRHPLSKRMAIRIHPDGKVTVSLPRWMSLKAAERFVLANTGWIKQKIALAVSRPSRHLPKDDYKNNKADALKLVIAKLEHFNKIYNYHWTRISIRNQVSRWGSCSHRGTLSFNYKLIYLRPELSDYIVIHELCHLKEFNHSKNFWNLVAVASPNYKVVRAELKKNGLSFY